MIISSSYEDECRPLPQSWMDILLEKSDTRDESSNQPKRIERLRRSNIRKTRKRNKSANSQRTNFGSVNTMAIDARISKSLLEIEDLLSISPFKKFHPKRSTTTDMTKLPQCLTKIESYVVRFNRTASTFDRLYRHFTNL